MKPEEFEAIQRRTATAVRMMNPVDYDTFALHLSLEQLVSDNVKLVTEVQLLNFRNDQLLTEKVELGEKIGGLVRELQARSMRLDQRND